MRGISNGLMTMNRQKADLRLVTLKQTIVAILMARLMELGATQWTKIYVGSIVVFLHVKPKALAKKQGGRKPCAKIAPCAVCASNGKTYNSRCGFEFAKCTAELNNITLTVKNYGPCRGSFKGFGQQ